MIKGILGIVLVVTSIADAPLEWRATGDLVRTTRVEAAAGQAASNSKPARRPQAPRTWEKVFQVPAGRTLPIELRTTLASDSSRPQDFVRGRLREAIEIDGVELVPAGAAVLGTVVESVPAASAKDRGRISLRFHVLEHPETGSRVMVRMSPVAYEGEIVAKKDAEKQANEVRLAPGTDVSAMLTEPFIVRIPVVR